MDIGIGKEINGIDIYGNSINGEITAISNTFRIATVKIGKDRLDMTTVSLDNIINTPEIENSLDIKSKE